MVKISELPNVIEPLKSNRFIIKFNEEVNVPEYMFRSFKIYNEGENIIFKTKIFQTVDYSFNPSDIFNITDVTIQYLDPIGEVVNGLKFKPKGSNMKYKNDYGDDGLSIVKFQFIVDSDSITLLNKNTEL